ncbi:MAG: DUF3037 domain-containing protein [Paramuribaculum sp.]|nr:DUF3037 domain-containing protein [Paramuribaculum sp.]
MQDKILYEYAVIRLLPKVEREEFVNVGLIMMSKRSKWIKVEICPDIKRIEAIARDTDTSQPLSQLEVFKSVCEGIGKFKEMPVEERFRWLTAVKSTCVQTSRPHPGITFDLDHTFNCLLTELVK